MTVAKKRRRRTTKPTPSKNGQLVTPQTQHPASQRVVSPACPACTSEQTHIYATRSPARYCKCTRCGFTWKFVAR